MDNTDDPQFTHVLQTMGILKGFSIAKTMTIQDLERIKDEAKEEASSPEECAKLIQQKLAELGNMHNKDDMVPGIIYSNGIHPEIRDELVRFARELSKKIKGKELETTEQAFVVREIIAELKLVIEDFQKLGFIEEDESDEDEDDYSEDDYPEEESGD